MGPAPSVAAVRGAVRVAISGSSAPVLVACSGGSDSLALAAATAFLAPQLGVAAGLVTVDHGLQPGSARQAEHVADTARDLGLHPVESVRVEGTADGGPEAAARRARYAALDAVAARLGARILLGHTLDDQAETVLLGLGRGSGARSICGMRPVDGHYLRPLLRIRRATTEAACAALGLQPWQDPHNADPRFQRVRLRGEVLPLLDDVLQGGVAPALARTADLLRDDQDALDDWADRVLVSVMTSHGAADQRASTRDHHGCDAGEEARELDVAGLVGLPRAIRARVLRSWATQVGAQPLTAERTAALDALIADWHGQGPIELPGGVAVRRVSGRLVASPGPPRAPQE